MVFGAIYLQVRTLRFNALAFDISTLDKLSCTVVQLLSQLKVYTVLQIFTKYNKFEGPIVSNEWLAADGVRLKHLRIDAGLDPATLARKISISPTMLKQLEDGGDSAFYSKAIKFQTGKKLLKLFGEDVSNPEPVSNAVEVAELSVEEKEQIAKTASEIIRVSEMNIASPQRNPILDDLLEVWRLNRSLVIMFSLGVVMLIAVYNKHTSFSESTTAQAAQKKQTVDVQLSAETLGTASSSAVVTKEASVAEEIVSSQTNIKAKTPPADLTSTQLSTTPSSHCKWSNNIAATTSPSPTKAGNYVFFISTKDVDLCVMDKSAVANEFTLKAGAQRNVAGVPPFRIYSKDLKDIKVFYQGYRVVTNDAAELMLDEVPLRK